MKRRIFTTAALGFALAGSLASGPAFAQTRWDLASAYPATNFHSENMAQLAADVDKATGGAFKRAVQGGQAQMGEILLANFQNEWQIYGADGQPFLATSFADAKKLYAAQKPMLEKKLGEQGMMLLYSVAWPPQGLYTKKPIESAADLKGIKWRAYSPATARIAELVGAQPVTVQAAEFSQALATGVVESTMTSGATGVDSKLYEHLKYYYDLQAWLPKNAVIVNKKAFDGLNKGNQEALLKAGKDAEDRGWAAAEKVNEDTLAKLKANGMQVLPPPQLKADLAKVGDTMLKEWLEKAGPEGKTLVDAYRSK